MCVGGVGVGGGVRGCLCMYVSRVLVALAVDSCVFSDIK